MTSLTRRRLLTAAGSSVLLQSLVRSIDAQAQGVTKKRFVLFSSTWGTTPARFGSANWTTTQFQLQDMLLPFAPYRSKLNIVNNLNGSKTTGSGQHGYAGVYTGMEMAQVAGNQYKPQGPSIDHYIASRIGMSDPLQKVVLLDAKNFGGQPCDDRGDHAKFYANASLAFTALFGASTGGSGGMPNQPPPGNARRVRLLDFTRKEVKALESRLVGAEKAKLQQYLVGIDDLEKSLAPRPPAVVTGSCTAPVAPNVVANPGKFPSEQAAHQWFGTNCVGQIQVLGQALICGLTRVGMMGLDSKPPSHYATPSGIAYHHTVQHGSNTVTPAERLRYFHEQNAYWMTQMVSLWRMLEAAPEGNGTMADNTLLVWMPGAGEHHGGSHNIPAIVLGTLGGRLQGGRFLRYGPDNDSGNPSPHRPNDFFVSLCQLMGIQTNVFGDPSYCRGPLPNFA